MAVREAMALIGLITCVLLQQGFGSPTASSLTATPSASTVTEQSTKGNAAANRKVSEVIKVPGWPDIAAKYPLAYAIKANGMVYASGLTGMAMHNGSMVPGGIEPQTMQTLINIQELLKAAGARMEDVVRCSVSLRNIKMDFAKMNGVYSMFWPKDPPARVAVEVGSLAGEALVEIQCDAALPDQGRKVVHVPGLPDLKGFPLSFATVAGGMVYLSGSQGVNMTTMKPVAGGVGPETTQTLENLKLAIQAAGSSLDLVVGCSVSLRKISDSAAMNKAYEAFWPKDGALGGRLPSRVCVEVSNLAGAGQVEIECTAAVEGLPPAKAPKAIKVPSWPELPFPFSTAVTASGMAYISGNQGIDFHESKLVPGGIGPETTQTMLNIKQAVQASGGDLADVVACEVSLANMEDFVEFNKAYAPFWPKDPPSRITVQVGALLGGAAVEIQCLAALPATADEVLVAEETLDRLAVVV
mmetsp:Transcript_74762/g.148108  ORF Transcript_74762/g.148108 Transcript_74762/m.148108 type:complete len:470 (+) Transcript_74762:56-1465(+)